MLYCCGCGVCSCGIILVQHSCRQAESRDHSTRRSCADPADLQPPKGPRAWLQNPNLLYHCTANPKTPRRATRRVTPSPAPQAIACLCLIFFRARRQQNHRQLYTSQSQSVHTSAAGAQQQQQEQFGVSSWITAAPPCLLVLTRTALQACD